MILSLLLRRKRVQKIFKYKKNYVDLKFKLEVEN